MDNSKLSDLVKSAVRVNLNYSASLLNLSRDYLRSMGEALGGSEDREETAGAETAGPRPENSTSRAERVPLIVAGRPDETANATFAVNNTSGMKGSVTLQARGEFPGVSLELEPDALTLDVGDSALVRILARFTGEAEVGRDMPGVVMIPELGISVTEFIVRRLPDRSAVDSEPAPGDA